MNNSAERTTVSVNSFIWGLATTTILSLGASPKTWPILAPRIGQVCSSPESVVLLALLLPDLLPSGADESVVLMMLLLPDLVTSGVGESVVLLMLVLAGLLTSGVDDAGPKIRCMCPRDSVTLMSPDVAHEKVSIYA
jgi:hypothetical protein